MARGDVVRRLLLGSFLVLLRRALSDPVARIECRLPLATSRTSSCSVQLPRDRDRFPPARQPSRAPAPGDARSRSAFLVVFVRDLPGHHRPTDDNVLYFTSSLPNTGPPRWQSLPLLFVCAAAIMAILASSGRCVRGPAPPLGGVPVRHHRFARRDRALFPCSSLPAGCPGRLPGSSPTLFVFLLPRSTCCALPVVAGACRHPRGGAAHRVAAAGDQLVAVLQDATEDLTKDGATSCRSS